MKRLILLILLLSVSAFAQFGRRGGGQGGRGTNFGPTGGNCIVPGYSGDGSDDLSTPRKIDRSGFVYARIRYHVQSWWRQHTREVPWHHDYPDGDTMFPSSLLRLTTVHTTPESYQIVDIDSPELFQYPFSYMSEPGYLDLTPADVHNLREYLDRGGFVLIDDFRGNESDNSEYENLIVQLRKLYPDRNLVPVRPDNPIFHVVFDVDAPGMLPPYRMRNSGDPVFLGIQDARGNIVMMIDFNNDISEYWQALDVGVCSIHDAGTAVELGVNYAVYSMTH